GYILVRKKWRFIVSPHFYTLQGMLRHPFLKVKQKFLYLLFTSKSTASFTMPSVLSPFSMLSRTHVSRLSLTITPMARSTALLTADSCMTTSLHSPSFSTILMTPRSWPSILFNRFSTSLSYFMLIMPPLIDIRIFCLLSYYTPWGIKSTLQFKIKESLECAD